MVGVVVLEELQVMRLVMVVLELFHLLLDHQFNTLVEAVVVRMLLQQVV